MKSWIELLLRGLIGAVLVWAAVSKLLHPAAFFSDLTDYQIPWPRQIWQLIAVGLPWFELLCGAALWLNLWPETIRPTVTILFGIFAIMLLQAIVRGLHLSCGCFSGTPGWFEQPRAALGRVAVLLGCSFVLTTRRSP